MLYCFLLYSCELYSLSLENGFFPDYEREECLLLKLVNFISYCFHYRRRFFFFSFLPANEEVGGKQGSRVGRRGGRKEDKENVKSVLIWGKYYPS